MFQYRRTPWLGLLYASLVGTGVIALVESPDHPMTLAQKCLFYLLSCPPGLGLAMLGDPQPRRIRSEYLKIDFYAPKADSRVDDTTAGSPGPDDGPDASRKGGTA